MRNWLLLLGLPLALLGCKEEKASIFPDGGPKPADAGARPGDGGTARRDGGSDAGRDASIVRPSEGRALIENLGEPCEDDTDCIGLRATCLKTADVEIVKINYPDGYCTTQCVADEECGELGACPSAAAAIENPFFSQFSVCTLRCDASDPDACREGYLCGVVQALGGMVDTCTPDVPGFSVTPIGGRMMDAGGARMDGGTPPARGDAGPDAGR